MSIMVVRVADEQGPRYEFAEGTAFYFGRPRLGWMMFIEPGGKTTILQESYIVSICGMDKVILDP